MILSLGEILFDNFPDYRRLGGAPLNFAMHCKNFGYDVRFLSRIGDDPDGKKILAYLAKNSFPRSNIQIDPIHPTGTVEIVLDKKGIPTFTIIPDVAYDYIEINDSVRALLDLPLDLIYFGTLIQRTSQGFDTVQNILSRKKDTPRFYDINLRPRCYTREIVIESLKNCDILKLNSEEMTEVMAMHEFTGRTDDFAAFLMATYSITMIAMTKGAEGSELFLPGKHCEKKIEDDIIIVDTVGAGDAFSALLALGYINAWKPELILGKASSFASRICGIKGAVPDDHGVYKDIIYK